MKVTLAALASACLFAAPIAVGALPAWAQSHGGGFHGGGGFRGGAGFHGGGFAAGGLRGGGLGRGGFGGRGFGGHFGDGSRRDGFRRDGFRRDRFGDEGLFDFGFGGYFDPWLYGDPGFYGFLDYDYGYGAPYPDETSYPPPAGRTDWSGPPPSWQYQSPPQDQAAPSTGCGSWVWDPDQSRYRWTIC